MGVMVLLFGLYAVPAAVNSPSWLDTVAPRITIAPEVKWHKSIFHVQLTANESAELWLARTDIRKMQKYKRPVSITRDGEYRIFYYGEDDFGNRSKTDSAIYILDTRAPQLTITPPPGIYAPHSLVRVTTSEPARLFYIARKTDTPDKPFRDSLYIDEPINGYIVAIDSAGNTTISDSLFFIPDTTGLSITLDLPEGIYNLRKSVGISMPPGMRAYYTFDPLAPPEWFYEYKTPFQLPHGLTILRYFGKSASGAMTDIGKKTYIIDTIPPRVQTAVAKGAAADTLTFSCKEPAVIRYTADGSIPGLSSREYTVPLVVLHEGISRIKAKAWDKAGNVSEVSTWEYKYDYQPPQIAADPPGGTYTHPVTVTLKANEPARFIYSLTPGDTTLPMVYAPGAISLTRQGTVVLRYRGIDAADNYSSISTVSYVIDSRAPEIEAVIQSNIEQNLYTISLRSSEAKVRIYTAVNNGDASQQSILYTVPLTLKSGDVLSYLGVDSVGNTTKVFTMNELRQPLVEARPQAGVYNRRVRVTFASSTSGNVWWRLLPDTLFRQVSDTIIIDKEGAHTFEYFLQADGGIRSAIRRNEYFLDWSPPEIALRVQKGIGDSAILFFDASENASIYYTTDGTNPLFSTTARTAGNKFQRSYDRISLVRNPDTRLAYYAEDAAGNQSALTILDVFRPRVIPNVPAGADRVHDRILSIILQSQEGTLIHYLRHGKTPTIQSPVFSDPINLSSSDTIVAFVVDGTGYQGEPETFIYQIDLPPSPQFSVQPETLYTSTEAVFDAKGTLDRETPFEKLLFRWDFDDDSTFDTDTGYLPVVKKIFSKPGMYRGVLEVIDEKGRRATFRREVQIRERCPADMIASFDGEGKAFCIDRYEWPNKIGEMPQTGVSWVEAKMTCIDAGKRLCKEDEWVHACNNNARSMYPYGDRYDRERCATEEKDLVASGSRPTCSSAGVNDMVGNAWEWVEEKRNDLTQAMGGSFKYGKDAHCRLRFEGTVASRSVETGFRCCK